MKFDTDIAPTVHQIMTIARVSERTARRWQREGAPYHAVQLIELTLKGRIMPEKWPQHWRFDRERLQTDSCHPAIGWQQLTWYQYIISGWYRCLALIPDIEATIDYLRGKLPKAEVIKLDEYRETMRAIRDAQPKTPAEAELLGLEPAEVREGSRKMGA